MKTKLVILNNAVGDQRVSLEITSEGEKEKAILAMMGVQGESQRSRVYLQEITVDKGTDYERKENELTVFFRD